MTNHPPLSKRLELFEYYWYTLDLELQIDSSVLGFIVILIRYLRFFRDKSASMLKTAPKPSKGTFLPVVVLRP